MLKSESSEEQETAAIALLSLGHDEPALEVLRGLIVSQHNLLDDAGPALPWLLWSERTKFFDELLAQQPDDSQLHIIAEQMLARDPQRGVSRLWQLLAGDAQSTATALAVGRAIMQAYPDPDTDNRSGNVHTGGMDQEKLAELKRYATKGTAWQKNIALVRLVEVSDDNAAELARHIYEEPSVPAGFRLDAFQLLLIAAEDEKAEKSAVGELAATDPAIHKLALLYLAGGREAIGSLRDELPINRAAHVFRSYANEAITIEAPAGVTGEMLKPLLADSDDEVAAAAGYLIVLSGSPEGLPTLVRVWRGHQKSESWTRLLYRAIAVLDDDQYTPLLAEINKQLRTWNKSQFYWTIRSMHGPEVWKLRKQIRDEVGMQNLR